MSLDTLARRLVRGQGRNDERGQSAFEFLLIIPFFVLFILLLLDLSIVMYGEVAVANSAREAARFAAVNCNADCQTSDVQQRAADRSSGFITDLNDVTVSWYEGTDRGDPVSVRVERQHQLLFFPFATIPLTSCADMRLEQQDAVATAGGSGC